MLLDSANNTSHNFQSLFIFFQYHNYHALLLRHNRPSNLCVFSTTESNNIVSNLFRVPADTHLLLQSTTKGQNT